MKKNEITQILDKLINNFYFDGNVIFLEKENKKDLIGLLKNINKNELMNYSKQITEFMLKNAKAVHYSHTAIKKDTETLDILKQYKRSINLTSIKPDINYTYGSYAKALYMQWSNPNGTEMDVIAEELKESGIYLTGINAADQFIEMVEVYNKANQEQGLNGKTLSYAMNNNTVKDFKKFVNNELTAFSQTSPTKQL